MTYIMTEEHKKKIGASNRRIRTGSVHSESTKRKISKSLKGVGNKIHRSECMCAFCDTKTGEMHYRWLKSLTPSKNYGAIHKRIKNKYGKANRCTNPECSGISNSFVWSNKDHKYSLDIRDWQMLCHSCHHKYDLKNMGVD